MTFADGVDADVQLVLGDLFDGLPSEELLFGGPWVALADVVPRPDPGVIAEAQHVFGAITAELQQFTAGTLCGRMARSGHAPYLREPDLDRVAELLAQLLAGPRTDLGQPIGAGDTPGVIGPCGALCLLGECARE